jgi:hypothetical protein
MPVLCNTFTHKRLSANFFTIQRPATGGLFPFSHEKSFPTFLALRRVVVCFTFAGRHSFFDFGGAFQKAHSCGT